MSSSSATRENAWELGLDYCALRRLTQKPLDDFSRRTSMWTAPKFLETIGKIVPPRKLYRFRRNRAVALALHALALGVSMLW